MGEVARDWKSLEEVEKGWKKLGDTRRVWQRLEEYGIGGKSLERLEVVVRAW